MHLSQSQKILRSINLEQDLNNLEILKSLLPLASQATMLQKINSALKHQDFAITITGNFGSGKSALALMLSALFSNQAQVQQQIKDNLTSSDPNFLLTIPRLLPKPEHCLTLTLIGSSITLRDALFQKLQDIQEKLTDPLTNTKSKALFKALEDLSLNHQVLIIIDEMGSFILNPHLNYNYQRSPSSRWLQGIVGVKIM